VTDECRRLFEECVIACAVMDVPIKTPTDVFLTASTLTLVRQAAAMTSG
jgi:hypothetical protein